MLNYVEWLLIGLPDQRPGGLTLTAFIWLCSILLSISGGILYGFACSSNRAVGKILQIVSSLLRGIPPMVLVFGVFILLDLNPIFSGLVAISIYSWSHTGEIFRSYMGGFPKHLFSQLVAMGFSKYEIFVFFVLPWSIRTAWPTLVTHWISVFKDTSVLLIIGVGELTTITKLLSDSHPEYWHTIIISSALLYYFFVIILSYLLNYILAKRV